MTRNNLKYLESIASIQFTPDTTFWATAAEFKIAASKLLFIVGLSYTKHLDETVKHFQRETSSAFMYTNTKTHAIELTTAL